MNLDPQLAVEKRVNQLHELGKFRLHAFENAKLLKNTKRWHDIRNYKEKYKKINRVTTKTKTMNGSQPTIRISHSMVDAQVMGGETTQKN